MRNVKIVAIGGGTGLSTMLRGLKLYTENITAIVTVSDNGGGSGVLRDEMNMLPPGDIRNCILALSNTEPIMKKLFNYRFEKGSLSGQSFGNLFLAAMNDIYGNFEEAVRHTSEVLAITGKVLPVTDEDVELCAMLEDDSIICGETQIVQMCKLTKKNIKEIYLMPGIVKPLKEALIKLREADAIILGPGSLYTSIIPNLLVKGIVDEIKESKAKKIYVSNIMTQPGETDGFNLQKHIKVIEKYTGKGIIDSIIINNDKIPNEIIDIYEKDGAEPVNYNETEFIGTGIELVLSNIIDKNNDSLYIRHDPQKLAKTIMDHIIN